MFVLSSDFDVPPFSIPNLEDAANTFSDYVEEREEEILKKLLGKTFYDQFIEGFEAIDVAWVSATTYAIDVEITYGRRLWKSLQNANTAHTPSEGAWWTDVTDTNIWAKLAFGTDYSYADSDFEWVGMSKMLIPYVYAMWLKDTYDNHSGIGIVTPLAENSEVISPARRISAAWNKFSDFAGGNYCIANSLYGFLFVSEADYPDYEYFPQGFMNAWNL